ncbi:MAG TPA: hypothetical protein VGQ83_35230 [Polyangia bacterium]|jgi:hypothetical protein
MAGATSGGDARARDPASLEGVRVNLPPHVKLAVPYNHDPAVLEALGAVARHVACVYAPVPPAAAPTGRPFRGPRSGRAYVTELKWLARRCAELGIGLNLIANCGHLAADPQRLVAAAAAVRDVVPRLRLTLADLWLAMDVRERAPWLELSVSCLACVATPVEALWWREQVGATHLVVARDVNRQPDRLEALATSGMTLGTVCCDICAPGCQLVHHHSWPVPPPARSTGAARRRAWQYHDTGSRCPQHHMTRTRPWLVAQKEFLPGHLRHLPRAVTEVKITGREQGTKTLLDRVRAYLEAESLTHPVLGYTEPPEAWDHLAHCDRSCLTCSWCAEHIQLRGSTAPG